MPEGHIYYCAIGEHYARMAEISAASVRRHSPGLPITVFTDQPVAADLFDMVIPIARPLDHYAIKLEKILMFEKIQGERGIFLDCDTFIAGDISVLFSLVDRYDVAVAYDFGRHESKPYGTHMNSGVIVFANNARTRRLWQEWRRRFEQQPWLQDVVRDQPAFDQAISASEVRMFVLAPEFNLRLPPFGAQIAGKVKIIHGPHHAIRDGWVESLVEFINSEDGVRAFDWETGQMRILDLTGTDGNNHTTETRVRQYRAPVGCGFTSCRDAIVGELSQAAL